MPRFLPPADADWERRRPLRLALFTALSWALLLATIWVQTHDPEIAAAGSAAGPGMQPQPGPGWATVGGSALLYGAPLVLWWRGVPYVLHLMAGLCILGGVTFALSAATGFLWNWRAGVVPLTGLLVNIAWLVLAYRRDRA